MTAPSIVPGSPEWLRTISPSKIAAIIGVSRWESPYSLWHRMAGNIPPEPPKQDFVRGHAFEHALAELWRHENPGWQLSPGEVQVARDDLGFPALATIDRRARRGRAFHIVEFKTARDLAEWDDGPPADYWSQIQFQQVITGYTAPAHLMVMGPFFEWRTITVPHDPDAAAALIERARDWHQSLEAGTPPQLDDSVPTYNAVRQLHPDIDGTTVEVDADLAARYLGLDEVLRDTEKKMRATKTRLLDAMGNAATAECYGVTIATRSPHGKGIALRPRRTATEEIRNLNLT